MTRSKASSTRTSRLALQSSLTNIAPITDCATLMTTPLQLHAERHSTCAAARAGHGDQDALLLFLVDVGVLQHIPRLLLDQFVKRQVADTGSVGSVAGGVLAGMRR